MPSNEFLVDGLYERPPWTPPICYMKPLEPTSFSVNLQERYKKYFVSNLSGHVMLFLIMSKYFKDINLNYIILANILYMVPYNHSIHEIFQAAKMMGINTEYSIEKTDLENINNFLKENQLNQITLPRQSLWIKKSPDGKTLLGGKGKTRKHTNRKLRRTKTRKQKGCGLGLSRPKPESIPPPKPAPKPKTVIFYENPVSQEYEDEPRIHPDEFYYFDKNSIDRTLFPNRSMQEKQQLKKIRRKAKGQYYARQPMEQLEIDIKEMRKNYKKGGNKTRKINKK